MNIACLGWGSLIWDPQDLPIQRCWFKDGTLLTIEFARQSKGERITLVIVENARYVRTLWTLMTANDIGTAKEDLAKRELRKDIVTDKNWIRDNIGYWTSTDSSKSLPRIVTNIGTWASSHGLDAVVWTNLSPTLFSEDEVISFLKAHPSESAQEYIRRTPRQIDTKYRRRIETELKWTPLDLPTNIC